MFKLLDKDLINIIGLSSQVTFKILSTDSLAKFTKHLLLLQLAGRIVNFQSSFVSRSFKQSHIMLTKWKNSMTFNIMKWKMNNYCPKEHIIFTCEVTFN